MNEVTIDKGVGRVKRNHKGWWNTSELVITLPLLDSRGQEDRAITR